MTGTGPSFGAYAAGFAAVIAHAVWLYHRGLRLASARGGQRLSGPNDRS